MPLIKFGSKLKKRLNRNSNSNNVVKRSNVSIRKSNITNPIFPADKIIETIILNNE